MPIYLKIGYIHEQIADKKVNIDSFKGKSTVKLTLRCVINVH